MAAAQGMNTETKDTVPNMSTLINGATVFGIGLALAMLAMSVGLVRSETAGDLRVLAATGASSWARRMLTAATAGRAENARHRPTRHRVRRQRGGGFAASFDPSTLRRRWFEPMAYS
jgi:hypothetical protein